MRANRGGARRHDYRTAAARLLIYGLIRETSDDFSWRYSLTATLFLLSPFDLLASLGMDMYLPVLPSMTDALGSSAAAVQLTLTAYLVLLGAGQLLFGPLSDRVGRRPVLLAGGIEPSAPRGGNRGFRWWDRP